jgi:hypothetical protein
MRRARSDVAEKFDHGLRKNASAKSCPIRDREGRVDHFISLQKGAEGASRDFFSNVKKCLRYA